LKFNDKIKEDMVTSAYKFVREHFSSGKMVDRYLEVWGLS